MVYSIQLLLFFVSATLKMTDKKIMRTFNPPPVHNTIIMLTLSYFLVQLVFSHTTHALTLLVDSYHVLCKLIYLIGTVVSINKVYYIITIYITYYEYIICTCV